MYLWLNLHCVRLFKSNFVLSLYFLAVGLSYLVSLHIKKMAKNIKWLMTTRNDVQFPIFLLDFPVDFLKCCLWLCLHKEFWSCLSGVDKSEQHKYACA